MHTSIIESHVHSCSKRTRYDRIVGKQIETHKATGAMHDIVAMSKQSLECCLVGDVVQAVALANLVTIMAKLFTKLCSYGSQAT